MNEVFDPIEQRIHVGIHIIGRQAGARGARHTERAQQRLGAMMAATQCHASGIQAAANLLRRKTRNGERNNATAIMGIKWPEYSRA